VKLGAGQIGNEMVDLGFDGARGVESLGFIGLELFDVVHCKEHKYNKLLFYMEHVVYQIDMIKKPSFY
jgi:hypothetical protein